VELDNKPLLLGYLSIVDRMAQNVTLGVTSINCDIVTLSKRLRAYAHYFL
jgi:hypothetical protein